MAEMSLLETIDGHLDEFFKGWNWLSTILASILILYLVYPLIVSGEPDTHPLLLSRQANISQIRQPGESAVYRSLDTPHNFPLKSGLNVKEAGAAKWATGKDGDLRDVWRRALNGSTTEHGMSMGETGKFHTVIGQRVIDHDLKSLTTEINIIGKFVKEQNVASVAVYLPNSVEVLVVIFAAAFYGFTPVLIPYGLQEDVTIQLLQLANAEFVIGTAGSIASDEMRKHCKSIKGAIWVVDRANREVDFTERDRNVNAWHELVEKHPNTPSELPEDSTAQSPPGITSIWLGENPKHGELVTFTQSNIVSAIGAQLSALPHTQRISNRDLFLPADSLTFFPVLIQTLTALYCNASVALHSVSGHDIELPLAASNALTPTIIACSAESASKLHDVLRSKISTSLQKFALRNQLQALEAGHMPRPGFINSLIPSSTVTLGKQSTPGKLRLLYLYERSNAESPPLSSHELAELRVFTGARIIYALTTPKVAGTVAQTGLFDYRVGGSDDGRGERKAHFGVPVSSIEIKVVDSEEYKTVEGERPQGEIVAKGPAVLGGSANLGVIGSFREDGTLSLSV